MGKKYDLAVKTSEYTNSNGETKSRFENIGVIMENDKGMYMMLKRTFNPAGVSVEPGRDNIMVSMFAPKDAQSTHNQAKQNAYQPDLDDSDSIPF